LKKYEYINSPELASVVSAARFTTLGIGVLYVIPTNLILFYYMPERNALVLSFILTSYVLLLSAILLRKKDLASVLGLISFFVTSVTTTLFGPTLDIIATSAPGIFLSVILGIATLPKKWIPVLVVLHSIHLIVMIIKIGIPATMFVNELPIRSYSIVQLLVVAFWFYHSWYKQLEFVKARDVLNRRLAESRESAFALQERTRTWRELLIHTHETVLNDIRAVLDSKDLNFKELKKQIHTRSKAITRPHSAEPIFSDLMAEVQEQVQIQIDLNISGAGTEIPPKIYSALRAVIVEVSRNFERHAGATKITPKASLVYGILRIELFHNGKDSTTNFESGIGSGIVIKETLDEINGKLFRRISGVEMSIALKMRQQESRTLSATDVIRTAVSTINVSNAVGGFLFPLVLMVQANPMEKIAGLSTLLLTACAAFFNWKRLSLNKFYVLTISTFALLHATATYFSINETNLIDILAINSLTAGFALVSILTWVDRPNLWLAGLPWLIGVIAFRTQLDPETSRTAISSLNTSYGLPAFAAAAVLGVIQGQKRLEESEDLSQTEIREQAAAAAVSDLAKELDTAITLATETLKNVSDEEKVSVANKNTLIRQDSLIRAIIQVDPKTSGGFSKAALEIVRHAVAHEVKIKVLTVRDQGLLLEIQDDLLTELKRIVNSTRDSKTSIQVLADSNSSILVTKISSSTAKRAGVENLQNFNSENVSVKIEESDDDLVIFVEQVSSD
jgi:signal transduction histidine kinase